MVCKGLSESCFLFLLSLVEGGFRNLFSDFLAQSRDGMSIGEEIPAEISHVAAICAMGGGSPQAKSSHI